MRQVLKRKTYFTYKDILRYAWIASGYYILMLSYAALVSLVRYSLFGSFWNFNNPFYESTILYSIIFGPSVSTILHAWFAEWGRPWIRMMMWVHTTVCFALIVSGGLIT